MSGAVLAKLSLKSALQRGGAGRQSVRMVVRIYRAQSANVRSSAIFKPLSSITARSCISRGNCFNLPAFCQRKAKHHRSNASYSDGSPEVHPHSKFDVSWQQKLGRWWCSFLQKKGCHRGRTAHLVVSHLYTAQEGLRNFIFEDTLQQTITKFVYTSTICPIVPRLGTTGSTRCWPRVACWE